MSTVNPCARSAGKRISLVISMFLSSPKYTTNNTKNTLFLVFTATYLLLLGYFFEYNFNLLLYISYDGLIS